MDSNALNLLTRKPSQAKPVHRTIVHEDLLDLADDGDDLALSRTPSTKAFLYRRESVREHESSDEDEDDEKQVVHAQCQLSWQEDLQIAMSELAGVRRAVPVTHSALDSAALDLKCLNRAARQWLWLSKSSGRDQSRPDSSITLQTLSSHWDLSLQSLQTRRSCWTNGLTR